MDKIDTSKTANDVRRYFDHDSAKQVIKEKYESKMLFAAFDGMWKAGPDLINITQERNYMPELLVLLDEYGNPCQVDPTELNKLATTRWQEQMNAWHYEYTEAQKKR